MTYIHTRSVQPVMRGLPMAEKVSPKPRQLPKGPMRIIVDLMADKRWRTAEDIRRATGLTRPVIREIMPKMIWAGVIASDVAGEMTIYQSRYFPVEQ